LTGHPLHGSGLAELPHPALVWGDNAEPLQRVRMIVPSCSLTHPRERALHAVPALSPGRGLPLRVPFDWSPSLHPLRRRRSASGLPGRFSLGCVRRFRLRARVGVALGRTVADAAFVRGLRRYYGTIRPPRFVHHWRVSLDFPTRPARPSGPANLGSPGSRARCFRTCTGSVTARDSGAPRDNGAPGVAFRISLRRRHPGGKVLSRLNTRPVRTPVNASTMPSRATPHDSGPLWAANPSTYDSFIHYTSPV